MAMEIKGQVVDRQRGTGLSGLQVELRGRNAETERTLLTFSTGDNGEFRGQIDDRMMEWLAEQEDVHLYFHIYWKDKLVFSTEQEPLTIKDWPGSFIFPIDIRPFEEPSRPEPTAHRVRLRLSDAHRGRLLSHFQVIVHHLNRDEHLPDVQPTDGEGMTEFVYITPLEQKDVPQRFSIKVFDREKKQVFDGEIVLENDGDVEYDLQIQLSPPQEEQKTLENLAPELGLENATKLLRFLNKKKIRTLEDLRRAGGIRHLDGLVVEPDDPNLNLLEAHTELSLLPIPLSTRAALVRAGYPSLRAVADASQERLIEVLTGQLDEDSVIALQEAAIAQANYIDTILTGIRAADANGWIVDMHPALRSVLPTLCGCDDCLNASSPAAYLADLLDYTLRHLRYANAPITLTTLIDRYHQPFRDLPANCQAVNKELLQIRIAIEVLHAAYPGMAAPVFYLETAYSMLLQQIGTSYDEMRRIAPSNKTDARELYAERLGITLDSTAVDDELDRLFLRPNQLDEAALDELFGLRDTRRPPTDADNVPLLLSWRLDRLRQLWLEEDWPGGNLPAEPRAFVDPDLMNFGDLPDSPSQAYSLYQARLQQIDVQKGFLNQYRLDPAIGLDLLLQNGTYGLGSAVGVIDGLDINRVINLLNRKRSGMDISPQLVTLYLEPDAFEYFATVVELYASGAPILQSEWDEVNAILIGRIKKRDWLRTWMQEEYNDRIVLSQDLFTFTPATLVIPTNSSRISWRPVQWRSTEADRRQWENTLRTRIEQERVVIDGLPLIVRAVEEALLWQLRDHFLFVTNNLASLRREALSQRYQIDFSAGPCQTTTRVAQAIETVQGLLFGARNGLLEDPAFTLEADRFDDEFRWMGAYANWRAAMQVFLYPENALRPTLRYRKSAAFNLLVERLGQIRGQVKPDDAEREATSYETFFADIATLRWAGRLTLAVPLEGVNGPMGFFGIGQGRSGKFYYATQRENRLIYSGHPEQTAWSPINGLENAQTLINVMAYQPTPGEVRIGTYARGLSGETQKVFFTSFDGKSFEVGPELNEVPALVRSAEYFTGFIPVSPNLPPDTAPWTLRDSDQMVMLDVDGDNRAEIVIFASRPDNNGQNRVGLLRWRDGGLYLDWVNNHYPSLNGWRILNPDRPLLFGRGVVIFNPSIVGGTQIAFLAWINGSLELVNSVRTITSSTGSWTVNLGSTDDPTQFVIANLDGSGAKLVILEHEKLAPPYAHRTRTMATVLDWVNYSFTFITRVEVTLGGMQIKLERPIAAISRFGPSGSVDVNREDIISVGTTVYENTRTEGNTYIVYYTERFHLKAMRWDTAARNFVTAYTIDREVVPAVPGQQPWPMDENDRVTVITEPTRRNHSLVIVSPTRGAAAVLRYEPDGTFRVNFHREGGIAAANSTGQAWNVADNDLVMSTQLLTDRTSEVLVVRPDLRFLGIIGVETDASLVLKWLSPGRTIQPPGARGAQGWLIDPNTRYLLGDLNGDGYDEITAFTVQTSGVRLALLRPVPEYTGVTSTFDDCGPRGIVDTTINSMYSPTALDQRRQDIAYAYDQNSYIDANGDLSYRVEDVLYLDEAYYFVPIELALRLNESGQYTAALNWLSTVFDYKRLPANPIIAYKLESDAGESNFTRRLNWLQDTLNPHAIAEVRRNSYIRYTLLTLVRCLMDFADAEFTRATSESVPRARELYLEALELLGLPQINQHSQTCMDLLGTLDIQVGTDEERWVWQNIQRKLGAISMLSLLNSTVEQVKGIMQSDQPLMERYASSVHVIDEVIESQSIHTFEKVISDNSAARRDTTLAMLADEPTRETISDLGYHIFETDSDLGRFPIGYWEIIPAPVFPFCIPPNRAVDGLRRHAQLNVQKIRACQNIAGMELRLDPYALPTLAQASTDENGLPVVDRETLPPLPYRYAHLVERAKQLVDLARQMEASMLSFVESADRARYDEIKARQDMSLTMASVRLHDLQLSEAINGVTLAEIQRNRASAATRHYRELVNEGLSGLEIAGLAAQATAVTLEAAGIYSAETLLEWAGAGAPVAAQTADLLSSTASYERRSEEWRFQRDLSVREEAAAQQQIRLAQNRTQIAMQERAVATMQAEYAEELLNFITLKRFGTSVLYEWMSGVLESVYRFFLQQATTMAKLAQAQLAFERQEIPPAFIKADYWEPPARGLTPDLTLPALVVNSQAPNLRGLTGSARLLRDIYELDQYAFTTNQRKLQLAETVSLSQSDPYAFQRFRESGILRFATPLAMFDAKFPGHYLRLIRQVRTTLIALIPPVAGIRATLGTVGLSRVVIGPDDFQTVSIQRGPESVALSSPTNATGLFEMDIQPELLVPFEGIGVDTNWEFHLPRSANRFDYNTIADVLITVEYTALDSTDYRQQILETTSRTISSDRAFSFRHHFADQWWDLHNPDQTPNPLRTVLEISREDFPANLDELSIQTVLLYFSFKPGQEIQLGSIDISYSTIVQGNNTQFAYSAAPIDGVISSRQGNWPAISNKPVTGRWDLRFDTSATAEQTVREMFANKRLSDILLVITYTATIPPWSE